MKNKAKDMCPRCKYCLGMTPQGMYSCGKADDGSELNIGIDVVLNCANFEGKDEKVEGKAKDWCKKCKHCNIMKCLNGVTEFVCEDPYDGMTKTLDADSDICCSMFEARPNPTHVCYEQEVKTVKPGEKVDIPDHGRYPWGKEKEPFNLNMPREALETKILDLFEEKNRLNSVINGLEKEKADHLKGIERLKKSQEKLQNQVKIHELDDKRWNDLNNKFCLPLCSKLYGTTKVNKTYDDILSDISELKDRTDGNYKASIRKDELIKHLRDEKKAKDDELEYWKERCHNAETDVTTLNSKVEVLDKRNTNQSVIIGEKGKEIENLHILVESSRERENELRQNIEEQDITIKALLLTIKEMCKED